MPLYDRQCNTCGYLYEVSCKIAEKDDTRECPDCGQIDGAWRMSAPAVSMEFGRFTNTDKRSGFGDVVQKIARTYPRQELAKRA